MKNLFLLSTILFSSYSFSQKGTISLDIKVVKVEIDTLPLQNARVRVIQDNIVLHEVLSDSLGQVKKIEVPATGFYYIKVDKADFALKYGTLNANFFDPNYLSGAIKFPMVVELVKPTENEDFAFLETEPMIEFYLDSMGNQAWDEAHLKQMLEKVDKCKNGWTSEQASNFIVPKENADTQLKEGNYKKALENYKKAQEFEDSEELQIAIKDCEIGIAMDESNELFYAQYVSLGEQLLSNKRYEEARVYFELATKLKPLEVYPQEKMAQCEAIVSSQK
jgi:tetratricopeptide (TPR) repeat protein